MNIGQMLVELGFRETPARTGFPTPAIINREPIGVDSAYGVDSKAEIEVYIDTRKTVGERATTKRSPGNWF